MPATVQIDPSHNLVTLDLRGSLDPAEATSALRSIITHPDLPMSPNGIVDTTDLVDLNLQARDVRELAAMAELSDNRWRGGRWAVIAPRDLVYGMARMYQMIRSNAPYEIGVFRTRAEGVSWLGR
jgi:hypothetical protein